MGGWRVGGWNGVRRSISFGLFVCGFVEFFGFMHAPAGPLDVDDDGVMDHTIHDGRGDDGVSQVVAEGLEADIRSENGGSLAIAGIDDLEEERGVSGRFLFEAVEAYLVNEKDLWRGVCLELFVETSVRETRT
jgi:hypothetical protein